MNQLIPAPRNVRQMLQAFVLYDPQRGLPSLLNRMQHEGVTRRQIYFNTLGRPPERGKAAEDGPNFNPRASLTNALGGREFQTRIREIVLNAFPEKRRKIFVHIPKCAGSDLLVTLRRQYPYLHHHLSLPETTDKAMLFEHLQEFAAGVGLSDTIAISGHVPLRWYQEKDLIRFEDEVFTTIRHPHDILYSYISFILTRLVQFQGKPRGDTTGWLTALGLTDIVPEPSAAYLADLGGQLLRTPAVTKPNMICGNLGRGTAESALDAMIVTDIEITDVARYSGWRTAKFGYEPAKRVNVSKPLFTPELASKADRQLISDMTSEDIVLYETIEEKLASSGGLSVRGLAFA
jgi:hypothetical protein